MNFEHHDPQIFKMTRPIQLQYYSTNFDRGASCIKELLWIIIKTFAFMPYCPIPSKARVLLLRVFGARIGRGVVIRSRVNVMFPWRLSIGDHSWIGDGVEILNLASVTIGDNCCVSQQAFLCTGSHDFFNESFSLVTKPIRIENSSWIAARCFIAPGVTVRSNTLCAAGSVVIRDTECNCIVGGNPATLIRKFNTTEGPTAV